MVERDYIEYIRLQKTSKLFVLFNIWLFLRYLKVSFLLKKCFSVHYIEFIDYFQEVTLVSGDGLCFILFSMLFQQLEALKEDNDDKVAKYLDAILKFDIIIAMVVAEHPISTTVALSNYFQKPKLDLLEAVQEAKIVVKR